MGEYDLPGPHRGRHERHGELRTRCADGATGLGDRSPQRSRGSSVRRAGPGSGWRPWVYSPAQSAVCAPRADPCRSRRVCHGGASTAPSAQFGLRLAVGARPALLGWQILREGLRVVGVGAALGLAGAWAALRLIAAQIFGVQTLLPWVMAAGVLAIAVTALAALMLPALRAVRTDPMTALRYE